MKLPLTTLATVLLLAGCSDEPPANQMTSDATPEKQQAAPVKQAPDNTSAPKAAISDTTQTDSTVSNSEASKPSGDTMQQVKQKASEVSGSIAESTKDWREKWSKMNENRVESGDEEVTAIPEQKADMGKLKQNYESVKQATIDAGKAISDKTKELTE